jgi:hypothetical protein
MRKLPGKLIQQVLKGFEETAEDQAVKAVSHIAKNQSSWIAQAKAVEKSIKEREAAFKARVELSHTKVNPEEDADKAFKLVYEWADGKRASQYTQSEQEAKNYGGIPEAGRLFDSLGAQIRKLPDIGHNLGFGAHDFFYKLLNKKNESNPLPLLAKQGGQVKYEPSILEKLSEADYQLVFYSSRSTPQVIRKDRGEDVRPKKGYGKVTSRRTASPEEVKTIESGKWLRVDEQGRTPKDKSYKITEYRKQLGEKRRQKLEKEASIISKTLKEVARGGFRGIIPRLSHLWNPNSANPTFGKEIAEQARRKGVVFVEPFFGKGKGSIANNLGHKLRKTNKFSEIGDWLLSKFPSNRDMGTPSIYGKVKNNGMVIDATPQTKSNFLEFTAATDLSDLPKNNNIISKRMESEIAKLENSKMRESKLFSGIGETHGLGLLSRGSKVKEMLDKKYPNGWVLKLDNGEASLKTRGTRKAKIFFSGDANEGMVDQIGKNNHHKWIVQPKKEIVQNSKVRSFIDRTFFPRLHKTWSGGKEYRVHVMNGRVIPYATVDRGSVSRGLIEDTIRPWRTKDQKLVENFAQKQIDMLSNKTLRKGTYGFDVAIGKNGLPTLIETNPAGSGASGFYVHPYVMDAITASAKGVLPKHVLARRGIYGAGALTATGAATNIPLDGDRS